MTIWVSCEKSCNVSDFARASQRSYGVLQVSNWDYVTLGLRVEYHQVNLEPECLEEGGYGKLATTQRLHALA
jgi:hypothetical protein